MGRVKEAIQSAIDEYGDIIDASYHKAQENWAEILLDAKLKSHHGIDERQLLVDEMARHCAAEAGFTHPNLFSWDSIITFYLDSEFNDSPV